MNSQILFYKLQHGYIIKKDSFSHGGNAKTAQ